MSDTKQQPKRKRRWFSFSLRTLLLVVTACCLFLGWWTNSAQRQKRAVAWVEESRGIVYYDWHVDDDGNVDDSIELEPNWLRDWLGVDYVHQVTGAAFYETKISDLSALADLKNLEKLYLNNTQGSDLSPLADLKNLEWLILIDTQVIDLSPLADLKNLNYLYIDNTKVSEEEIQKLKKALPKLEVVR